MGNYQVILSLLSSIDQGRERKNLVDTLIENCDQVINLREVILEARLQYSICGGDEKTRVVWLDRAVQAVSKARRPLLRSAFDGLGRGIARAIFLLDRFRQLHRGRRRGSIGSQVFRVALGSTRDLEPYQSATETWWEPPLRL